MFGATAQPGRAAGSYRIAFARGGPSLDLQIWTMNADGSNPQPVTTGPDDKYSPTWSPDGTQIAFSRAAGGDSQIWAVNADGSNPRALTTIGENVTPDWSPVANRIAFARGGPSLNLQIWVMDADGGNPVALTSGPDDKDHPAWSPDGSMIAFEWSNPYLGTQIWVMNADGSAAHRLTSGGDNTSPAWSPDGTRIVFSHVDASGTRQLDVANVDASGSAVVTSDADDKDNPSWSPDGGRIAFDRTDASNNSQIWVVGADGSNPQALTSSGANITPAFTRPVTGGGGTSGGGSGGGTSGGGTSGGGTSGGGTSGGGSSGGGGGGGGGGSSASTTTTTTTTSPSLVLAAPTTSSGGVSSGIGTPDSGKSPASAPSASSGFETNVQTAKVIGVSGGRLSTAALGGAQVTVGVSAHTFPGSVRVAITKPSLSGLTSLLHRLGFPAYAVTTGFTVFISHRNGKLVTSAFGHPVTITIRGSKIGSKGQKVLALTSKTSPCVVSETPRSGQVVVLIRKSCSLMLASPNRTHGT